MKCVIRISVNIYTQILMYNLNVCLRPFERREAMADVGLRM